MTPVAWGRLNSSASSGAARKAPRYMTAEDSVASVAAVRWARSLSPAQLITTMSWPRSLQLSSTFTTARARAYSPNWPGSSRRNNTMPDAMTTKRMTTWVAKLQRSPVRTDRSSSVLVHPGRRVGRSESVGGRAVARGPCPRRGRRRRADRPSAGRTPW